MLKLNKDTLSSISSLLDEIHDYYFEFNDIVFDRTAEELTLFLGSKRKGIFGKVIVSKVLKISGVTARTCVDTAEISQNSINEIHIDIDKGFIDIECNAPAEIHIQVKSDFEILLK